MNRNTKCNLLFVLLFSVVLVSCGGAEERKRQYLQRGNEFFEQGHYIKARLEFKNVLQIDPNNINAHYMYGRIEEKNENWQWAYEQYLKVVEIDPHHFGAQVRLGKLYLIGGEPEKALDVADEVLKMQPTEVPAMVLRAHAQSLLNLKESAIEVTKAALDLAPDDREATTLLASLYAEQGKLNRAIDLIRASIRKCPDQIEYNLLLARLYEQAGDSDRVLDQLGILIRLQPAELNHRLWLASYYQQTNHQRDAENVLQRAIIDLPENVDAKLALIQLLNDQDKRIRAEKILKRFVDQEHKNYKLHLALAVQYLSTDQVKSAKLILRAVIDHAEDTVEVHIAKNKLAVLLLIDNNFTQALKLANEVLAVDPKDNAALLIRATIALEKDEPDKSIKDLRLILRGDQNYVEAYQLKARAQLKKNDVALARQSLEAAFKLQPQKIDANNELVHLLLKSGELDDAIVVLEEMRRNTPDNLTILLKLADIYSLQQKWEKITQIAYSLFNDYANRVEGHYFLGLALQGMGEHVEAIKEFEKVLDPGATMNEPLIAISRSQQALGKPEAALETIQQVTQRSPDCAQALNLEGEILVSLKQYMAADKSFEHAIAIQPSWPIPYQNRAAIRMLHGQMEKAISMLREGYKTTHSTKLGMELAIQLDRYTKSKDAMQIYQELLVINPDYLEAANNLAMMLLRGNPDKEQLDKVMELVKNFETSNDPMLLDTLGWARVKQHDLEKAVNLLEQAKRIKPGQPEIEYHLGVAYYGLGRIQDAKKCLELALASDDKFVDMTQAKFLLAKIN